MKKISFFLVAVLLSVLPVTLKGDAKSDEVAQAEKSFRNLLVGVSKLKKAPTIDGKVDAEEWKDAAMTPRLITWRETEGNDQLSINEKKIYFGYTDDALYLAFQFERPQDALQPRANITKRDTAFINKDDAIEFMLCSIPGSEDFQGNSKRAFCKNYYFLWNLIGTQYDRLEYPSHNIAWNPEWEVSCRFVPGYGWEGEARWPFKILEQTPLPKAGDMWRYNLVENNTMPTTSQGLAAFSLVWSSPRDFARMLFRGADEVFVRVLDSGVMRREDKQGIKLEVVNPGAQAQQVAVKIQVYKRKPDAPDICYLRALDQSRDRPEDFTEAGRHAPLFFTDEKVAGEILKAGYELKKEFKETVSLAGNERKPIDLLLGPDPGTYVLIYDVSQGEGPSRKVIAGAALPFVYPEVLALKTLNYILVDQSVQVKAELAFVPGWTGKGSVQAQVKDGAGKTVFEKTWREEKFEDVLKFDVGVKGWKAGEYRVEVVARNADDKELARRELKYQLPEIPQWFTKKAGMEPLVPEPYKAIECAAGAGEQKLKFLMGEYELKDSVLPHRMEVRSVHEQEKKDMLRGPILLKAKINGKETVVSGAVNVKEAKPELVLCQSKSTQEGLETSMDGAFEYDGMEKVTLRVSPSAGGSVPLEGLWLEIPMKKEYSDLAMGLGEQAGVGPFVVPKEGVKLPFREMISLGNEERRLVWFAENYKGWKWDAKSAKEAIEFVREADGATTLKINLIKTNVPFPLEKEREIVFGLMFTPAKMPYPKYIRHGNRPKTLDQLKVIAKGSGMNSEEACYGFWEGEVSLQNVLHGWPEIAIGEKTKEQRATTIKNAHSQGVKFLPYAGWGISRKAQVYPLFGAEMTTDPVQDMGFGSDAGCWNTPLQDVFISLFGDRIGDSGIDGYRMDAGFADLYKCSSLKHHGYGSQCGWIDDDGKLQGGVAIFAARKAAERGYRLFHKGVHPDGLCIQARAPGKCPPLWSFYDASLVCEGMDTKIRTIKELPLEFYRVVDMGDTYGVTQIYWPKSDVTGADSRYGIALLHNFIPRAVGVFPDSEASYSRSALSVIPVWNLVGTWMQWPDPKTEFWGYWKNGKYVQTSSEDLKSSFYVRRGERMLLSAMNLERKPMEGTIKVNLAELGFKQAYAQDAITGEEVAIEGGAIKLDFLPEGYRLLKITAEKLPSGLPKKIGDNLLADFDPATLKPESLPTGWIGDPKLMKVENGVLELSNGATLTKSVQLAADKRYVLELEARVECEDGAVLGPSIVKDCFQVTFQGGGDREVRTIASQRMPGQYETLRLVLDQPMSSAALDLKMNGKGKALIRKIGLYPINPYTPPYAVK